MTVSSAPAASNAAAPGALAGATGSAALGRDDFLQLLVAQLRNQDPTSPQKGHEFAAQLAQFSTVEQLTNIGATLSSQSGQLAALASALEGVQSGQAALASTLSGRIDLQAASALVGKTVEVSSGALAWDGSGTVPVTVRLPGGAREVEVTIRDADGAVVRTLRTGALDAGDHDVAWDGTLADGSAAPAGAYTATVSALGPDGGPVAAAPVLQGTVERLSVEGDGVFLWVGGHKVPFGNLLSVAGTGPASADPASANSASTPAAGASSVRSSFLPMP